MERKKRLESRWSTRLL